MVFRMKTWMLAVVVMLSGGMASGAEVKLYAEDGTYLGKAGASPYDPESIDNPYGIYGSQYSATSIRNPYGKYGLQSNQIGPVVRRQVTPIPRPAESAMDGFWKGYRQGYDSVERMAQRRREQQAEHEQRMQQMREQWARDAELNAIQEQTREIRELREALDAQRYQQQAAPVVDKPLSIDDWLETVDKEKMRNAIDALFGSPPDGSEVYEKQTAEDTPEEKAERERVDRDMAKSIRERRPTEEIFSAEFYDEMGWHESAAAQREVTAALKEEKRARLEEEGRREWEAIKAQWAAEDAAAALKKTAQRKE